VTGTATRYRATDLPSALSRCMELADMRAADFTLTLSPDMLSIADEVIE
jgi:hypothetical protein